MLKFTVSQTLTDENCFFSLSDALAAIPDDFDAPVHILVKSGIYHEKVTVLRPFVTIEGEDALSTVITYDDYANMLMEDGSKRGTFRSYTMFLDSHDITLSNLTIRNASTPRSKAGQAIALYADGDKIIVKNCRLESYQDTLFTGPLPPTALSPGGFIGPKEFAPRINGRQYYKDCYICGDIDFIFGSATAYFENCEISSVYSEDLVSKDGKIPVYSYATASSTAEGQTYGYVFSSCRFTGTCPDASCYLGRPWRNFAKTVLLNCYLGSHIKKEGFHDWNKTEARDTIYYAEYQSYGEGAATADERAPYVKQLTEEEALFHSKENVLSGEDNWKPY